MSIETVLREGLAVEAGTLTVSHDPWPGFAAREARHRRGRRVRVALAATALIGAVGVQSNLVPVPGWTPGIAVAGVDTSLAHGPVRGSLAEDRAWLDGMRRQVQDISEPDEWWRVTDRSRIRFVYAGEVAGERLVLAVVPLRFGFITTQELIWYRGAAGAAPEQMEQAGNSDGGTDVVTLLNADAEHPGSLVVVAPTDSTVSVSTGFTYSADGRVRHTAAIVSAPGSGLAEITLPPAPSGPGSTVTVTARNGRILYRGPAEGSWTGPRQSRLAADEAYVDAAVDQALRGVSFDRSTLRSWVASALGDARLDAESTTVKLRWTGLVDGQPAALFTLRQPGGGVLAYAMHGSASSWRGDLRLLLPAADADRRPIAWRMRAEGKDDRTGRLVVVAPPEAARAVLTVHGAAPVPVPLDADGAGFTGLNPGVAASVTAYGVDGAVLASTPVPPFETDSGGIPGDTPETRVVA